MSAPASAPVMKKPGPDHPITIEKNPLRVRVVLGGVIVAETTNALTLREASYPPVQYVPREDIVADLFGKSERRSHCPYKGDASYFSLCLPTGLEPDAVWSYENPFPAVAAIAGHLAFYRNRVDSIDVG